MSIKVRTALEEDFLAIYQLDYAANVTHPFYVIPWKVAGPGASEAFVLDRYKNLYHSRNPECGFLVAMAGDEIVGYLLYKKPPGKEEPEEWSPDFPDGTDLRLFELVEEKVKVSKKDYNLKDCWGTCLSGIVCTLKEFRLEKDIDHAYRTGGFCGSSQLAAQRSWIDIGQEISRVCRCRSRKVLRAFVKDRQIVVREIWVQDDGIGVG